MKDKSFDQLSDDKKFDELTFDTLNDVLDTIKNDELGNLRVPGENLQETLPYPFELFFGVSRSLSLIK